MTKENLLKDTSNTLRMKDLRRFVEANKEMSDETPCVIERVEDKYFENNGWDVLLKEGEHYHRAVDYNKTERQIFAEKELEELKEQFYQPHCITTDKEIIYIYSHY